MVERSGHLGFSAFFFKERPEAEREEALQHLEEMGAWFEWYAPGGEGGGRLYAIDVPPGADWERVYRYLKEAQERGLLGVQTSWRGKAPPGR